MPANHHLFLTTTASPTQFHCRRHECRSNASQSLPLVKTELQKEHLLSIPPESHHAHMNLWMLSGTPPDKFKISRVVTIPKVPGTSNPAETRPIAVGPAVARLFHRILSKRLQEAWPIAEQQKGFLAEDGVGSHSWTVNTIIKMCKQSLVNARVTFVDIKKAFDSVSHQTLLAAATRMGTPPILLRYIHHLHQDSTVFIKGHSSTSDPIKVERGVRQGDPMSPILFNAVMDWVLSGLDKKIGINIKGTEHRLSHLAYADDLVLFSSTDQGARQQLNLLQENLALAGLQINAAKSATLSIVAQGKRKRYYVDNRPFLMLGRCDIPALSSSQHYKYLGTELGARNAPLNIAQTILEGLRAIGKAPLTPQQSLYFLKSHLIPSQVHKMSFNQIPATELLAADNHIRQFVRRWMHLPGDSPSSFLGATLSDGGLGVRSLLQWAPILITNRITSLLHHPKCPSYLQPLLLHSPVFTWLLKFNRPTTYTQVSNQIAAKLYTTSDGKGLASHHHHPSSTRWLSDEQFCNSKDFLRLLHIRASSLYTSCRASRGRPEASSSCKAGCCQPDDLSHRVQVCPLGPRLRTQRHNMLTRKCASALEKQGYSIWLEPHIPTSMGYRIPDMVATNSSNTILLDTTIVGDQANLNLEYKHKVIKYSHPDILQWLKTLNPSIEAKTAVTALVANWRGAVASTTVNSLKEFDISKQQLLQWSVDSMHYSHYLWRHYASSTWSHPGRIMAAI